jgi:hypothetical protein
MRQRELNSEEIAAILAGLRLLQLALTEGDGLPPGITEIYEDPTFEGGDVLDDKDIDTLCEMLNTEHVLVGGA